MRFEACLRKTAVLAILIVREQVGLNTVLQSMQSLLVFLIGDVAGVSTGELVIVGRGSSQFLFLTTPYRLDLTDDFLDVI